MFVLNGTIVIFVVSFLAFMWLLDLWFLKPVGKAIARRQEKMQNDLEESRQSRAKATSLLESYEAQLKERRSQAQEIVNTALAATRNEKAEEMANLRKDGLARLESAKGAIATERHSILDDLAAREKELVEAITGKVLGEPVAVSLEPGAVRRNLEES
jgi:F-type H+-transporting ATPase subunit b